MAKYECTLRGGFDAVLDYCMGAILHGSVSASIEDGSDCTVGSARVAVRVFERYSAFGGNRVSLSLTLVGQGEDLFLSAITAGGSQAMFFKMNTIGEESFLNRLVEALEHSGYLR